MVFAFFAATVVLSVLLRGQSKKIQVVPFVFLLIFAAFRYGFGNDYYSYQQMYYQYQAYGADAYRGEYLFGLLNCFAPSYYVVIAITSAVFLVSIYWFISKNLPSQIIWMGLAIFLINPYLFLMNLSSIRQCLAMVCFLIAVRFAFRRNMAAYVVIVLFASTLHSSALLLLPMYFVANDKKVGTNHIALIAITVFAILFAFDLTEIALWVDARLQIVNYSEHFVGGKTNSLRATLLTTVYFVYVLGNLPRLKGFALACGKLYLIGLILGIFAYDASMLTRYQMYFDIFSIIVLPLIFANVQSSGVVVVRGDHLVKALWDVVNKYVLPLLILVIYLLRCYSFSVNPMWSSFMDYSTIFALL